MVFLYLTFLLVFCVNQARKVMGWDENISWSIIIKDVLLKQYVQFLCFSSLIFHFYQCRLCKPDTFVYVKQMQNEAVSSAVNIFFQS